MTDEQKKELVDSIVDRNAQVIKQMLRELVEITIEATLKAEFRNGNYRVEMPDKEL